jgi:dolichyl-phosphate-mannose--protein O-mannosyl transferase
VTLTQEPAERTSGLSRTADGRAVPSARRRLVPILRRADHDSFAGWATATVLAILALFLHVWNLGRPNRFLFDETYYAKDAWALLHHGYVTDYVAGADKKIIAGQTTGLFKDGPSMVVHPEVGKWVIALGEKAFGLDAYGWRISSAVVGALMVFVMVRLVRRLTGSNLLGGTAGLLLTVDGLHFVMSRSALLDIFMAFFLLCAVACLVADRDWGRMRLARLVPSGYRTTAADWGPVRGLLWRPWRLSAGIFFGLACGTKWNALFPLAAFGILVWLWDAGARRSLGVRNARARAFVADAIPAFLYLVVVALVVYVVSWTGWLLHAEVYERALSNTQYGPYWGGYLQHDAQGFFPELAQSLRSLWNYHQDVYTFHTRFLDDATHSYQSKPQWWLVLNRPVGMQADLGIEPGQQGCTAAEGSTCLRQVLLLGTPALWWGAALAFLYAIWAWLARRDWRFGLVVVGVVSTWLPWLRYDDRPIFSFYAISILPFTVIGLTLSLGVLMGGPGASATRRLWGTTLAGAFVVLVVLNFAWFWPVYTGELITTPDWLRRIWFKAWI